MNAVVWQGKEAVFLGGVCVYYLPAGKYVGVNIYRIDRVGYKNGIVLVKQVKYVSKIALCSV